MYFHKLLILLVYVGKQNLIKINNYYVLYKIQKVKYSIFNFVIFYSSVLKSLKYFIEIFSL